MNNVHIDLVSLKQMVEVPPEVGQRGLLKRSIDRHALTALGTDKRLDGRESGEGVQSAAVGATGATDFAGRQPQHNGSGLFDRNGTHHHTAFVADNIGFPSAKLDV